MEDDTILEKKLNIIKENLRENEEVLWKNIQTKDLLLENRVFLKIGIFGIIFFSLLIVLIFLQNSFKNYDDMMWIQFITIFFFLFMCIIMGYVQILEAREKKIKLGIPKEELKHYKEIFMVTNQRIIQRSYENLEYDVFKYDTFKVKQEEDMIFVPLDSIDAIYVEAMEDQEIGHLDLFFKYDVNDLDSNTTPLSVRLLNNERVALLQEILKQTSFKQEVVFQYGEKMFFREKREFPESFINLQNEVNNKIVRISDIT